MAASHEAARHAISVPMLLCHGLGKHITFMFVITNFSAVWEELFVSYIDEATIYLVISSVRALNSAF